MHLEVDTTDLLRVDNQLLTNLNCADTSSDEDSVDRLSGTDNSCSTPTPIPNNKRAVAKNSKYFNSRIH